VYSREAVKKLYVFIETCVRNITSDIFIFEAKFLKPKNFAFIDFAFYIR
jgi:hypothetical protein